jgi:hypothetical protein
MTRTPWLLALVVALAFSCKRREVPSGLPPGAVCAWHDGVGTCVTAEHAYTCVDKNAGGCDTHDYVCAAAPR